MPKGLVVYDSATGNTEKMAIAISRGMQKAGLDVETKRVKDTSLSDLVGADAIVFGAPTYFATMSNHMKKFIDETIKLYPDKLKDKVGAAFTSSQGLGDDMTLLSLIVTMLMYGMIIVGHQSGWLGATSIEKPDDKCIAQCETFGERIAEVTKALARS